MEVVHENLNRLTEFLNNAFSNPYVSAIGAIIVILYAGLMAPKLPAQIASLFDYTVFKIMILALILYIFKFNPTLAILVAVAFFISLQTLSRFKVNNLAANVSRFRNMMNANKSSQQQDEKAMSSVSAPAPEQQHMGEIQAVDSEVSGLADRSDVFMGPQGMEHPVGYSGPSDGASF